jgi:alpha-1,6-mannosyltransferase
VGFTALFSVTLIFLYPVTAMDVYNYAVQGHVLAFDNVNPLVDPPSQASNDLFVIYAGSWMDSRSPYGPVWLAVTRGIALMAGPNVLRAVLLLKTLAAGAVVATTAMLAHWARRRGSRAATIAALSFGWNPLVQLELVGNGHNDAVMTSLLVVAFVLVIQRRPILGVVALAASTLVKYLTVEALPFLLLIQAVDHQASRRLRIVSVVRSIAVFVGVTVLMFAPYWVGPVTLERARIADDNYLSSIPALAILIQPSLIDSLIYPRVAILSIVGLWQTYRIVRGQAELAGALFEVSFATILLANHYAGWYLPLLMALAVLTGNPWTRARIGVLTFTTTLTTPLWAYVWPAHRDALSLATFHFVLVPLTFLPPLLVGIVGWAVLISRRRSTLAIETCTIEPQPSRPVS